MSLIARLPDALVARLVGDGSSHQPAPAEPTR